MVQVKNPSTITTASATKASDYNVPSKKSSSSSSSSSTIRWYLGMIMASVFSLSYFVAPFYMITALTAVIFRYPCYHAAWLYASPILLSAILPPISMPWLLQLLSPMLEYFHYEEIHEAGEQLEQELLQVTKNYLLVFQPHGAISFVGICSAINSRREFQGKLPTAVADALLYTPILKHILGIFGLISASKSSMVRALKQRGAAGTVVLYVGGMAELFLSCEQEERLYLKQRKGFIKLALQQGVDVVPVYLFGNTTVLSVWKPKILATLSRKLQVSLTYIWGKWGLPIPRDCKLLYVSGKPLGMPHLPSPTNADIEKWHAIYCKEVQRLFDQYKERVPEYKHKKLEIV